MNSRHYLTEAKEQTKREDILLVVEVILITSS